MTLPVSVRMLSSPTGPTSVSVHGGGGGGGGTSGPRFPRPRSPHPLLPSFLFRGENRWLPTPAGRPHHSRALAASAPAFLILSKGDPP